MDFKEITQDYIRGLFLYDPDTGIMYWGQSRGRVKRGYKVGSYDKDGYLETDVCGKRVKLHRLAWFYMTGKWPIFEIDHIDLVKDNNKWSNLREATKSQNSANRPISRRNKSGYKGVIRSKNRWIAHICHNKKQFHIGSFKTAIEAHEAYLVKAHLLFAEFARES